jgi:hypothetical protein
VNKEETAEVGLVRGKPMEQTESEEPTAQDDGEGGTVTMLMKAMADDSAARDDERAARYIATVRPAMAAVRYVRTDHQEAPADSKTSKEAHRRQTGEGAGLREEAKTEEDDPAEWNEAHGVVAGGELSVSAIIGLRRDDESSSDAEAATEGGESDEVVQARRARRQARKQRKRARVKLLQARAKQLEGEVAAEVQPRLAARRNARIHDEAVVLSELEERRTQRQANASKGDSAGTRARVSLAKHRRKGQERPGAAQDAEFEYVGADDGLPTATMELSGVRRRVKLDSGARYTIAGTDWMQHGDRVARDAPVDYVEGIGGFLLDVVGVWRFIMRTVFDEVIHVDACIVAGCTDEFLLGVDFMKERGATMDFERSEVHYHTAGRAVVIPFRTYDDTGGAKVAAVRLARRSALCGNAVVPVQVAVAAEDGERGIFLPTCCTGAVMLAATVTRVKDGKAWVPAVNALSERVRLPTRKELGQWIPLSDGVAVLEVNGKLQRERVMEWLGTLGDDETPSPAEDSVNIGAEDEGARAMVVKLSAIGGWSRRVPSCHRTGD